MVGRFWYQLEMQYNRDEIRFVLHRFIGETSEQTDFEGSKGRWRGGRKPKIYTIEAGEDGSVAAKFWSVDAALVAARAMLYQLPQKGLEELARQAWLDMLMPSYDTSWFMYGVTEHEWEAAFHAAMQEVLDEKCERK